MNLINQNESNMNLKQIEPEIAETVVDNVGQEDDKELIEELKKSFSLTEEL